MAKTSVGIKIFVAVLVVAALLLAGAVVAYKMELIPGFSQKVHGLLGPRAAEGEDPEQIQQEETLKEQGSVKGLFPHLIPVSEEEVAGARKQAQEVSPSIYSKSNLYTIEFFQSNTDGNSTPEEAVSGSTQIPAADKEEPLDSHTNPYPVVASSADFYDTTVFIDAEPALVCLDKESATETLRIPCQVYPLETLDADSQDAPFAHLQSYYFKSKTGNWYEVRFERGSIAPESLSVAEEVSEKVDFEGEIYAGLLPSKTTLDFIEAKMNGLLSVSPAVKVPHSVLYSPEREAVSFPRASVSPALVFSPREQGNYTLGLCDEEGAWIRDNAFVVLYTMAGEALAISLDYVADRPQITTHLSDQELYIACVGFFPDSLILDAGPTDDFREDAAAPLENEMDVMVLEAPETAEAEDSLGQGEVDREESEQDAPVPRRAWFQVKKAP